MTSLAPEAVDRTVYPEEERVGEDIVQRWIVELLRPLLERWFHVRGVTAFVGADQFIYFVQYDAHRRVAPDVYVLPGVAPDTPARSWKTWESGVVPSFALEVVSSNWEKDYYDAPVDHQALGTRELVLFDPAFAERREGVRWQRYLRNEEGTLVHVENSDATAIDSAALGCALRVVGIGSRQRLRLADTKDSLALFPTGEEAERQAKEAERQAKEAERQAKEAERQAKEVALARIAELEERLAKFER